MSSAPASLGTRVERRKARTRSALIGAAQRLIAGGRTTVPILEITQAADVGLGSFYNHFATKEELFEAAVDAVLDDYGEFLDRTTAGTEDPAEAFACSFRLTGRLFRSQPELSRVVLSNVLRLLSAHDGLAPRARRDIAAGAASGRFDVEDLEVAVTLTAAALVAVGHLVLDHPDCPAEHITDRMTEDLLRMLGVPGGEAHRVATAPLPGGEAHGAGPRT